MLPDDRDYDETRRIWNAMIDRKPLVIVQCAAAGDVPHALAFARENGLEISIRGAGHNIAGNAVCDNGVMIDIAMRDLLGADIRGSQPCLGERDGMGPSGYQICSQCAWTLG